MANVTQWMTWL